ncbi:Sir2 family NAD-dependent protein deacetylase [Burkholderia sp. Ax-1719]|uniref:SIR2 family NAD-dependent protein deacylase n=1 Tax=Burkholderia sp. Ax-1719 TaxID=2608334 RepID=UPI00142483B2|nr:Sir2 family NAD-dependent protein deacetylase [Burkholderia sp. Ax-1719]NIE64157.1 NAD-dependent deacetylase [Burkholderia sp. Ax-1719]
MNAQQQHTIEQAAQWIGAADGLLVTAGAGMGVDSGLPDFRGNEGLWRAYPALKASRIEFESIANPAAFRANPQLAWGFYGHRMKLYRETQPHGGFAILQQWARGLEHGAFVFTSNVDGQFQRAGFDAERVVEYHGSIHHLQCSVPCCEDIWAAEAFDPQIDAQACRLVSALPRCAHCGEMARPNVLMFGDAAWLPERTDAQLERLEAWLGNVRRPVVIEMGAGTSLPTVRRFSERNGPRVVRINPREPQIDPASGIGIQGGARQVLEAIDAQRGRS